MASASLWPSRSTGEHLSDGAEHSELYLQEHLWNVVSGFPASPLLEDTSGGQSSGWGANPSQIAWGKIKSQRG